SQTADTTPFPFATFSIRFLHISQLPYTLKTTTLSLRRSFCPLAEIHMKSIQRSAQTLNFILYDYRPNNSLTLSSSSFFSALMATTLPFLSIKNEAGIASTCHLAADLASQPLESFIWSHVILSLFTAFIQSCLLSSSETLRISKPFCLYLLYNLTRFLFENLHGAHHEAQKSSKKTLPFNDDKRSESPFISGNEKSSLESVMFGIVCDLAETAITVTKESKK